MQKYIGVYWDSKEKCCELIDIFSNDMLDAFNKLCNIVGRDNAFSVQLAER